MFTSICLLSCALTLGQPTERADWQLTPQLAPGLELVYTGTYLDESLIPNVQHQKQYRLETTLLVLETGVKDWRVGIMTALSLQDEPKSPSKQLRGPSSVRVELARVDWQGRAHKSDKKLLETPIHDLPTLESGFLVPAPLTKVGRNFSWDVTEPGQPMQRWQVIGTDSCGGLNCIKIVGVQQSDDWANGRADKVAWRRRDFIWLHPQLSVAQRVERIVEHRAAARETPTHRTIVRYDLDSHLRYPARLFDDRKDELLKASKFQEDTQALLQQPVLNRTLVDSLIHRVSFNLDHPQSGQATPYRKAFANLKTVLENAKKGERPVQNVPDAPFPQSIKVLDVGERVPDFAVSSLTDTQATRLKNLYGKPILVVFFNPATPLGRQVLDFAKQLSEKHVGRQSIMAMAVTNDADVARKQHQEMRLTFPILDGNGLRLTFGAVETPRFVVVDGNGLVRLSQTGWGFQTPAEIDEMLQRCEKK